jgi:hypothetical protein
LVGDDSHFAVAPFACFDDVRHVFEREDPPCRRGRKAFFAFTRFRHIIACLKKYNYRVYEGCSCRPTGNCVHPPSCRGG